MKRKINILLVCLFAISCLYHSIIQAKAVGNNTAVFETLSPILFPAADSNNSMYGFVYPKGGFTLQDATTSCTYNSVMPVSGTVNMNGGTLYLLQDLILTDTAQLEGLGTIIGNNHTLSLCRTVTYLPADLKLIKDLNIFYTHDLDLLSSVTVQGNCYIYGHGNTLDLGDGGAFIIDSNSTFEVQNQRLEGIEHVRCVDDTGHVTLNNVIGCLEGDWTFANGGITYNNNVTLFSPYLFDYSSAAQSNIGDESTLLLDGGIRFKLGRKVIGGADPLLFYDTGSVMACGDCSFLITASGIGFQKGVIQFLKNVIIETEATGTTYGIFLGDGISALNDASLSFEGGSVATLLKGAMVYNDISGDRLLNSSPSSKLALKFAAEVYLATTCTFPANTIEFEFDGVNLPLLAQAPGTTLYLNNTSISLPGFGEASYIATSTGNFAVILSGENSIYSLNGILPLKTHISNSGNIMNGTGSLLGNLTFENSSSILLLGLQGTIEGQVSLNGGTLILTDNCFFSTNFTTSGTINLRHFSFTRNPSSPFIASVPLTWLGGIGTITMVQDMTLTSTWTIEGDVVIDCNGRALNFAGGSIIVAPSSNLTFHNIQLNNIMNKSFYCVDDTASITLDNVTCAFSEDFDFDYGALNYNTIVQLLGEHTFAYNSIMPATIGNNARLILNSAISYKTGRATVGGPDPLLFYSKNSTLVGERCTFIVTASGLALTRGQVQLNGNVIVETESTGTDRCLIFGNNISAADDLQIFLNSGCLTELRRGTVVYNNVNADGFKSTTQGATFQLDVGAKLHLATTCTFPLNTFVAEFDGVTPPIIRLGVGAQLYLDSTRLAIPSFGDAVYQGVITDSSGFVNLINNDSIYLINGALLLGTHIVGSRNSLGGVGSIATPVTFEDSASSLFLNLQGTVAAPVSLNGGLLKLNNNVLLTSSNFFPTDGIVDLQDHVMTINPPATHIVSTALTWSGSSGSINFTQDVIFSATRTFVGNITLDGNDNTISFTSGGAFAVSPSSQLTIRNTIMTGIGPDSLYCMDNTATITLDNVRWVQSGDLEFDQGTLICNSSVLMTGPYTFAYTSSMPAIIGDNATLTLDGGLIYKTGRKVIGGLDSLIFSSNNSTLVGEHCNFVVTASGLALTKGQVHLNGNVIVETESTNTDSCLIFGNNISAADDLQIYLNSGCLAELQEGTITYNNVNSDGFKATTQGATFQLDVGAHFHLATTSTFPLNTFVAQYDGINPPDITLGVGAQLYLDNTRLIFPGFGDAIYHGLITVTANAVRLQNNDSIYMSSGSLLLGTGIIGSGNVIAGSGSIDSPTLFASSASSLLLNILGQVNDPISLNGGTLTLGNNTFFSSPYFLISTGTINLQTFTATFNPINNGEVPIPYIWYGNGGAISFLQDFTLSSTQIFNGNVILDGNGNALNFAPGGALVVAPSSSITLKNMSLNNLGPTSIYCMDNTGTIILDNTNWVQSDNYEFTQGALIFRGNVLLSGQNFSFSYLSTMTSYILANSTLTLDNLLTFSYVPSNNSTTLLAFTNETSQFSVNHSVFNIVPGLQLTSGRIAFSQAPTINAGGAGLIFGDDVTTTSDMQMIFLDASTLTIAEGQLAYKNLDLNSNDIQLWNSNVINFAPTTTLQLYKDMNIQTGQINFGGPGPATYEHKQTSSCCSVDTDIYPGASWGGVFNEVCFCP